MDNNDVLRIVIQDKTMLTHDEVLRLECLKVVLTTSYWMPLSEVMERARRFETFVKERGGSNA